MAHDWSTTTPTTLLARGVLGIVFGLVVTASPVTSGLAFVMLWGFWVLLDAVGALVQAARPDTPGRLWFGLVGGLGLVAAVLAIVTPAMTAVAATWVVGVWLAFRGGVELFSALGATGETSRWLLVVGGATSVLLGVLLTANPGRSAIALATWFGLALVVWGVVQLALAYVVRRDGRRRATSVA